MANLRSFLASRVGRRLVLLFGVCALLPLLSLAALSYGTVRDYLLSAGHGELRDGSKAYAMSLMDRLLLLESLLLDAAAQLDDGAISEASRELLERRFEWLGLVTIDGRVRTLAGAPEDAPGPVDLDRLVLRDGVVTVEGRSRPMLATYLPDGGDGSRLMLARVRPAFLWWGATEEETLPPNTEMLVLADETVVFSTIERPARLAGKVIEARRAVGGRRSAIDWEGEGGAAVAGFWSLPLDLHFTGDDWTVVWSRSRAHLLLPVRRFAVPFALVLTATFLGVVFLALWQIRRFMHPLVELREGTARLAGQDFTTPVEVSSNDEFEDLAIAFNEMARQLGDVVEDLHRHQLGTLRALARAIDERSSWTLGHSGRVAQLSQRMARILRLPAEERRALYRAALLHDIGKLRLPSELLDKPDALSTDELGELREHVDAGVRILTPIPEYEAIRPIVAQHHERLDGSGYPRGLRGDDIVLGARILAVADSFDALSCDRPYRPGLSVAEVLAELDRGAGTLYDPQVLEALHAVVRGGGLTESLVAGAVAEA